ncbi:MAG: type II toxin-antitoxin system prevent-host-death family antitoxin [Deltaproteobacteria bacterium]|nr:type II toxin-antitoxin system prevent-host-death family antitoxin [Deltaproteobacteria bacterium]
MLTIDKHEAQTCFEKLLKHVSKGKSVHITESGKVIAQLIPTVEGRTTRKLGLLKGQIKIAPDFDNLPDDILAAFNN